MKEENLDPENWEDIRRMGHLMIDDMVGYLSGISKEKAWEKPPQSMKDALKFKIPHEPTPIEEVYADFKSTILPYNKRNIHPRFASWVEGTGTAFGALADMWASTMNPNVTIGDHSAMYVDAQVINWCKEMMGFSESSTGMLVSGGSIANITAMIVARNSFQNIKQKGLQSVDSQLVAYCSAETHNCIVKAMQVIGIGEENLRKIAVDEHFKIRTDLLEASIAADLANGLSPFCIIGNAGTVNTGAIDDLTELSRIAAANQLWFHVDGAFGALVKLLPEYDTQTKAIETADSVAFDLHKWMYMPYEIGCVLVKDAAKHRAAFAPSGELSYLIRHERGLSAGLESTQNYGMELSRNFKALKAWFSIREHGIDKYARQIRQNVQQCIYLGELVKNEPNLDLLTPVTMNIVCFRFMDKNLSINELNELNKNILMELQ
jgi:aromatic-L-amino-acid/L-tryptophan decarboxylase